MKALIMNSLNQMELTEVPEPQKTDRNIIVKTRSASICGTDMRNFLKGSTKIQTPRVLGHEFAGDIIHAGTFARDMGFNEGDRITAAPAIGCGKCWSCITHHQNMCDNLTTLGFQHDGAFAEYIEIPEQLIKMGNVIKLSDNLSYDDGTLIEPAACALNGQNYMRIQEGDYVAIYGSGIIGCMHAELAFLQGAKKVFIIEPLEKRGKIAEKYVPGITWINPNTSNTVEEIKKLTEGRGADVVITATSVPSVHVESQEIAAKRGRISLFGGLAGESKGFLDSNLIHYKELQVCGVHATTAEFMKGIMKYMSEGKLDAKKYIEKIVDLDDILSGFYSIRDEGTMKVIIHF